MTKKVKNYKLGFSLEGFLAFLLIMIPNIIWAISPPNSNPLAESSDIKPIFEIILNISQWIMVISLIIFISRDSRSERKKLFVGFAVLCLAIYYISWIIYYIGVANPLMFIGMALFPTLYFIFVECWLKNYIAIMPTIIFGITHITITFSTYLS